MARTRKPGSLTKRGNTYSLQLNHQTKRRTKVIRHPTTGASATNERDAEKWREATAEAIRQELASEQGGRLPLCGLPEAYEEHLGNYAKRNGAKHIDAKKGESIAPQSKKFNLLTLNQFLAHLAERYRGIGDASQIAAVHVESYMAKKGKLKHSSYNRYLAGIQHLFATIPQLDEDAVKGLRRRSQSAVKSETESAKPFTDAQVAAMRQKAAGWIKIALEIGLETGLRLGDVVTLKWSEIDLTGDGTFVDRKTRKASKRAHKYSTELSPTLLEWREQAGEQAPGDLAEFVFPEQASAYLGIGRKPDTTVASKQFTRFLKRCDIKTGKGGCRFHSLRANHAGAAEGVRGSIEDAQEAMQHSSAATTETYVQLTLEQERERLRAQHRRNDPERRELHALADTLPIETIQRLLEYLQSQDAGA